MHKKGLSAVVTSVLLVLGVIVFSGVIWFVIQGLISSSQKDISSGVNLLNLKIAKVYVVEGRLVVEISRKVGRGSLNSINFVLETGTDNEIIKQETNLKELENYKFILSLTKINPDEINKVSIAPDSGEVVDVWEIGTSSLNCVPSCEGKVCGDDGCGGVCAPGCTMPEVCNANGQCICTPKTCTELGKTCGSVSDGCGVNLNCGAETKSCNVDFGINGVSCFGEGTQNCVNGNYETTCNNAVNPKIAFCNGKQCGDDGCGGVCAPGCTSTQDCSASGLCLNKLRIFVTTGSYTGNLGGVSGADDKCNLVGNGKPAGGTGNWKALIGTTTRQVGVANWVLKTNRNYFQADGMTLIDTTAGATDNQAWFTFTPNLDNAISSSSSGFVWTGLSMAGAYLSSFSCLGWTSNLIDVKGKVGYPTLKSTSSIDYALSVCSTPRKLYCIEQEP